jgi:hypothetical protein
MMVQPSEVHDPDREAILEAKRKYHYTKYRNDPVFRQKQMESNRRAAAKLRAAAKALREAQIASGEIIPRKPGRPRKNTPAAITLINSGDIGKGVQDVV